MSFAIIKENIIYLALAAIVNKKLMPESSVKGKVYCHFNFASFNSHKN